MMVAVGRLQLSVRVAPTNDIENSGSNIAEPDLERAFRAQQRREQVQAERERTAMRYRILGGPQV